MALVRLGTAAAGRPPRAAGRLRMAEELESTWSASSLDWPEESEPPVVGSGVDGWSTSATPSDQGAMESMFGESAAAGATASGASTTWEGSLSRTGTSSTDEALFDQLLINVACPIINAHGTQEEVRPSPNYASPPTGRAHILTRLHA